MRVVIIPDSFKGTLTSFKVIERVRFGLEENFQNIEIIELPIADGGEGTVNALVQALKGIEYSCLVKDALGRKIMARYGVCGYTAVIEMAEAAGICKILANERDIMEASTFGVGELILQALSHDVNEIIIGIGGSATNDGGVGMLQALGAVFYDENGHPLIGGGKILGSIRSIDISAIDQRIIKTPITVMCDVTNPLTGPNGATAVYGPQKGGSENQLKTLEEGMINLYERILEQTGLDVNMIPGSGAAGGLGAALVAFLGATLKPGIELILDLVNFDALADEADLVITGEGRIDNQTVFGKVPVGVGKRCIGRRAKVIAIAGIEGDEAKRVYDFGIDVMVSTVTQNMNEELLQETAESRLDSAIDTVCRLLKIGMSIN